MIGWYIGRYARHGNGKCSSTPRRRSTRIFPPPPPLPPAVRFRGGFSARYLLRRQLFSLPRFVDCAPPRATISSIFRKGDSESRWNVTDEGKRRRKEGRKRRVNRDEGEAHCRYIARAVLSAPSIIQVARLTRCTAPRHTRVLINSSLYVCLIPGDPSTRIAQPVQLSPHVARKIPGDRDIATSLTLDVSIFVSSFIKQANDIISLVCRKIAFEM